ncbi:hypothetical protein ACH4OW_12470 [Streptomyces sp. NPDC017056]|uniref:hypothetical protein n=1 Tax=Streptomyces sp. NPDC017056 TaxID=3364973 RepID=UPI00379B321D
MSHPSWEDEERDWRMYGSASDDGAVYQAGRDQHITETHYHFGPGAGRELDSDDEDVPYVSPDYATDDHYCEGGFLYGLGTALLFLLTPVPLLIVGTSIQVIYTSRPSPSTWWSLLYSLVSFVVAAGIGYRVLTSALQRTSWSYAGDRFAAGISVLGSLALFVYSLIRDPAQAGTIGEWAHLLAETLGPT